MNAGSPRVSFLIVNLNGGDMLRGCLDSIAAQTFTDYEVVVVDNGSTDGSRDQPHFARPGWKLIRFDTNKGFSVANNRAFAESSGEWIALVNNDVTLETDWLALMMAATTSSHGLGSVACRLLQASDPARLDSAGFEFFGCATASLWAGRAASDFDRPDHAPFGAAASAALYRRQAIDSVGLFHPEYFAYYEDTDLSLRLVLYGYGCAYAPSAVARHRGSATGGHGSDFKVYHLRRNVELLFWVDMVGGLAWRFFLPHLLYESLCLFAAAPRGRLRSVLRAKRDAWHMRHWIGLERRRLYEQLRSSIGLRVAQQRLLSRMTPWWRVFFRSGNRQKFRQVRMCSDPPG